MRKIQIFFNKPFIYILVILIGIGLKFYKLDQQFFWDDEVCTILHTTGISMAEYERNIPVNVPLKKSYYDDLLKINNKDYSIFKQIIGLSKMPQLTPGHYYYLIFWTRIFGDGFMSYRYFSVLMFILALPVLFLLARKIFKSDIAGWIAASLYAVSPFFQVFAQESRYYILWSLGLFVLHYVFLMALDKNNRIWWFLYIVSGFLVVHISIMTYIMLLSHFVYFMIFHRDKWKPLILSLFMIFLSSVPWLIYIYINRYDIQNALEWQKIEGIFDLNIIKLLKSHFTGIQEVFINVYYSVSSRFIKILSRWVPGIFIILSIIIIFSKGSKRQIWFLSLISFIGLLSFIIIDLLRGSFTSYIIRYHLLYYAGFILMISFAFKFLLEKIPALFVLVFLLFISAGTISSKYAADYPCTWKRADCEYHLEDAADLFAGQEKILIISDYQLIGPHSYTMFMSLMAIAKNKNIDIIYAKPDYPDFRNDIDIQQYDKVYAMYLSEALRNYLKELFNEDEMTMIKDRTLYGSFYLPVYSIIFSPEQDKTIDNHHKKRIGST